MFFERNRLVRPSERDKMRHCIHANEFRFGHKQNTLRFNFCRFDFYLVFLICNQNSMLNLNGLRSDSKPIKAQK